MTLAATWSCKADVESSGTSAQAAPQLSRLQAARAERQWFLYPLVRQDDVPASQFGWSVAISGNTAVVGAPAVAAVYVFVLDEEGWRQQARLAPPRTFSEKDFGKSVAISGDTVIVGAESNGTTLPGAAYVYVRSGTSWGAPATLAADDGSPGDYFGRAVTIDADTAVVGAPLHPTGDASLWGQQGAAYVFSRSGSSWVQSKKLVAADGLTGDWFGQALELSGNTLVVGSPLAPEGTFQGRAYVFSRSGGAWNDGELLPTPDIFRDAEFGHSVALLGDVAVVGARHHRGGLDSGYRRGAAFVYTRSGALWSLQGQPLLADDGMDLDAFGTSVAVSEDTVLVGAPGSGTGTPGHANTVYVYSPFGSSTIADRIGGRGVIEFFGGSLDLDGDVAVVGTEVGQNGAYAMERRVADGGACDSWLDCSSRQCVDGVCCNVACAGACESCATGTCTPLARSSGASSCAPYLCGEEGGECPTSCTAHSRCVDSHYCGDDHCVPRLPNGGSCKEARACLSGRCVDDLCAGSLELGAECSSAVDCETGYCVDGFCCDQPCEQQCEACDVRGARGTCSPVTGVPRGQRPTCAGDGTPCGGACDGEHRPGCEYPTSDLGCGTSCTDAKQTDSACNGQGACEAGRPHSCGGYRCDADAMACRTSCASTSGCATGFTCIGERCEPGASCVNEWTAQDIDGLEQSCRPYRCESGRCRTSCDDPGDCTPDRACSRDGQCVRPPSSTPAPADSASGCSLSAIRANAADWSFWAMAALVAGSALWRKRSGPRLRSDPRTSS
jgi:hypothetical protein